jgi:hypothetical protein
MNKSNINKAIEDLIKFYTPCYKSNKESVNKRNIYKGIIIGMHLLKEKLKGAFDDEQRQ